MAKKSCSRTYKESGNHCGKQDVPSDEITLRDEILDLKRQVMILKRTNEQYSVRLRKYEDEAKRKDKQLEQLMNPRKNADITKVLSTKGAAILMNLKDQNNALIQMLLNKDLHIRRLAAEVKMSKLYASTKRNEYYKAEIGRLRNLLMKSEEMLRENIEVQQEQMRSICVGGNPISESSSSSDQSSSRDLDELRYTILSLESHIKYSNDLLTQKNREISLLSDELNFLRRFVHHKGSKSEVYDSDISKLQEMSTIFTRSWPDPLNSKKLSSRDLLDFFERTPGNECGPLPHSAPAAATLVVPSASSTPKHAPPIAVAEDRSENHAPAAVLRTDLEYSEVSSVGKSLFHNLAREEILKADKMLSRARKPLHTKEKWKQAFTKYKELKKLNPRLIAEGERNPKPFAENEISSKFSDLEIQKFEVLEKDVKRGEGRDSPITEDLSFRAVGKLKSEGSREEAEKLKPIIKHYAFSIVNDINDKDMTLKLCQTYENSSVSNKSGEHSKTELSPGKNSEYTDKYENIELISSSLAQRELKTSFQNNSKELEHKERKSLREVYYQHIDSSFDSEDNYSMKEFRQVQVEVQINAVSLQNCPSQMESGISDSATYEFNENNTIDFEFNDDDDVIVR